MCAVCIAGQWSAVGVLQQGNLDQFEGVKAALGSRGDWLALLAQKRAMVLEVHLKLCLWSSAS